MTARVLHELPDHWIRERGPDHTIVKLPLSAMADVDAAIEAGVIQDHATLSDWDWVGCSRKTWYELLSHVGDKNARTRAEKKGVGKLMESRMKADLQTPQPRASVVGAVVAPAAIAGHPLSCVRRQAVTMPVRRFWVNLWAVCFESAESFFARLTDQLAEAVAVSRRQPVEIIAYAGGGCSVRPFGKSDLLVYTVIPVSLHDWNRLGAILHPAYFRRGYHAVEALGAASKCSGSGFSGEGRNGERFLQSIGVNPDTFKP